MFFKFTNYNLGLEIKKGTKLINKSDFFNNTNLPKEAEESCLFVLQEPTTDSITYINFLGYSDSKDDMKNIIQDLISNNLDSNYDLLLYEKLKAINKQTLHILNFNNEKNRLLMIATKIKSKIVVLSSTYHESNDQIMQEFNLDLAKSIVSLD